MKTLNSRISVVFCLALLVFPVSVVGNDGAQTDSSSDHKTNQDKFQFDARTTEKQPAQPAYDLKSSLGDTGIKVAICVGIFLISVILLSKNKAKKSLPIEAVEILGNVSLGGRQNIQLIRFGQKLVLVEASPNGLKPISEITDPAEVNRMLDLIRPRTQ